MTVSIDRYSTSKFILKDDKAVEYIKFLVELTNDNSNLVTGKLNKEIGCSKLIHYKDRAYQYFGDGFINSSPELKNNSILSSKDLKIDDKIDEDDYDNGISLFVEIQKNLEVDGWFFVDNHTISETTLSNSILFYHQDGRVFYYDSYGIKKDLIYKEQILMEKKCHQK